MPPLNMLLIKIWNSLYLDRIRVPPLPSVICYATGTENSIREKNFAFWGDSLPDENISAPLNHPPWIKSAPDKKKLCYASHKNLYRF